jgi:hypothetical protein
MNHAAKEIRDADLRRVEIALRRAAAKARKLGRLTKTPVVVLREGKIIDLTEEAEPPELAPSSTVANLARP